MTKIPSSGRKDSTSTLWLQLRSSLEHTSSTMGNYAELLRCTNHESSNPDHRSSILPLSQLEDFLFLDRSIEMKKFTLKLEKIISTKELKILLCSGICTKPIHCGR